MAQLLQVIIPTYRRVDQISRVAQEIYSTPGAEPFFVVHESDLDSAFEVAELGLPYVIDTQPASGVNASNCGYWHTTSEWFVLSQDDITHHEGWLDAAQRKATETGAQVVGLNDGATDHSVAWLIHRPYVQEHSLSIGHPNVIFNPDYTKNFSDNELNDTAKYRGVWAYAVDSITEHLHPGFGKKSMDETYRRLEEDASKDRALYMSRRHLWS